MPKRNVKMFTFVLLVKKRKKLTEAVKNTYHVEVF